MRQGAAPPASCAPRPRWPWPRSACWRCPPPPPPPTSGQCPPRPGPPAFPSSRCSKANFSLPLALAPAPAGSRTQTLAPVIPSPISGSEFAPRTPSLASPTPTRIPPSSVRALVPFTAALLTPSCPRPHPAHSAGSQTPTQAPGLCRRFAPCPRPPRGSLSLPVQGVPPALGCPLGSSLGALSAPILGSVQPPVLAWGSLPTLCLRPAERRPGGLAGWVGWVFTEAGGGDRADPRGMGEPADRGECQLESGREPSVGETQPNLRPGVG